MMVGWAAISGTYSNSPRPICVSSQNPTNPTTARWYNRNNGLLPEDPWLSTIDHFSAQGQGKIIYGEANTNLYTSPISSRNGVYIFIRDGGVLDSNGCSIPTSEPTNSPSTTPPSESLTYNPTQTPTDNPTTPSPSNEPTTDPTIQPTSFSTSDPSVSPSMEPTLAVGDSSILISTLFNKYVGIVMIMYSMYHIV